MMNRGSSQAALSFRPRQVGGEYTDRQFTFNQIKVQVLEIANEHIGVQKAASELFFHLVLAELWRHNGQAVIRDADLAALMGWSCDKVSRAVRQLDHVGIIDVERGRWSRATEYSLAEWVWTEAIQRRRATEKVSDFPSGSTPQNYCNRSAKNRTKSSQKRPATKESQREIAAELLTPHLVPLASYPLKQWNDCLEEVGVGRLQDILPLRQIDGTEGYWLPGPWPAGRNTELRVRQLELLRRWIEDDGV
ncbi:MAG: hypothetical protein ABJF50_08845 [Paracoccaceae bacterium]